MSGGSLVKSIRAWVCSALLRVPRLTAAGSSCYDAQMQQACYIEMVDLAISVTPGGSGQRKRPLGSQPFPGHVFQYSAFNRASAQRTPQRMRGRVDIVTLALGHSWGHS